MTPAVYSTNYNKDLKYVISTKDTAHNRVFYFEDISNGMIIWTSDINLAKPYKYHKNCLKAIEHIKDIAKSLNFSYEAISSIEEIGIQCVNKMIWSAVTYNQDMDNSNVTVTME